MCSDYRINLLKHSEGVTFRSGKKIKFSGTVGKVLFRVNFKVKLGVKLGKFLSKLRINIKLELIQSVLKN